LQYPIARSAPEALSAYQECIAQRMQMAAEDWRRLSAWRIWRSRSCAKAGRCSRLPYGSQMVVKNYNIMGVAKAALEARCAIWRPSSAPRASACTPSPGPLATRAASGIPEFDELLDKARAKAPTLSLVSIDDVRVATALLAYDATRLITGETLYITAATTSSTSSPRLGLATEGAGTAPAPSMKR